MSENYDNSCLEYVMIVFLIIKLATQTIFNAPLANKIGRFDIQKVMLKSEFVKKKSSSLKFLKVGIMHLAAQTPITQS